MTGPVSASSTTRTGRPVRPPRGREKSGPHEPIYGVSHAVGLMMVTGWALAFVLGVVWNLLDERGFWFMSGSAACLIITMPLVLMRKFDLVSPWSLIMVAGYIGFGLRGLFIALNIKGLRSIDELFLLGHGPGYFTRSTLIVLVGLALLTLGYVVAGERKSEHRPVFSKPDLDAGRVAVTVLVCAVIGFVAFVLYARATGGFSLGQLSAKRTVINGVNLEASYQSHGGLRVLNTLAALAFWLQLAFDCYRQRRHGLLTGRGAWLAVLFVNAALLPVYASTRSDVVYLVIGAVIIEYCLNRRGVNGTALLGSVLIAVIAAAAMSSLRSINDGTNGVQVNRDTLVDTFVLTRTFADIPTSGNIINAVPTRLPYANGSTITAWLVAPVPRSVWPQKPLISSGPILGAVIYGNKHSGVPPGAIAESYWNFGLGGVLILPFLCGWVMRRINGIWAPWATTSPSAAIVMAVVAVRPGIDVMTNSVGFGPFQLIQSLVLLAPVLWIVGADHSTSDGNGRVQRRARALPAGPRVGTSVPRG